MRLKTLISFLFENRQHTISDTEGSESFNKFNFNEFKKLKTYKEMIHYVTDNDLERIGCGGNRCVYVYSDEKVIKLGRDGEQNKKEFEAYKSVGKKYTPEIYEHADNFQWILSERVKIWKSEEDFESDTGLNESWLYDAITFQMTHDIPPESLYEEFSKHQPWDIRDINPNEIGEKIIINMAILSNEGFDDVSRWDHWGIAADGRIVCIDLGLTLE